jgi:hypothetical protein
MAPSGPGKRRQGICFFLRTHLLLDPTHTDGVSAAKKEAHANANVVDHITLMIDATRVGEFREWMNLRKPVTSSLL